MSERITNSLVHRLQPGKRERLYWDRDLKGFGLKVTTAGRKVFVVQYRLGGRGSPTKRFTIGTHESPWTAKSARIEAERVLHLAGLGQDPSKRAKDEKREQRELRFDRYAEQFLHSYAKPEWADRTYRSHESNLRRWVSPVLRSKPISLIARRDVTEVLDRIPSSKPALPRNVFVLMRKIFNWAIERGDLQVSPMQGMRVPKPAPERHHILSDDELLAVAAHAPDLGPVWGNFVHLLILTGQRRLEVAHADWSEFDRSNACWTVPRHRTKNGREHNVPLNRAAIAVLDEQAGDARWPRSGFVFSFKEGKPISGFSKMKARFDVLLAAATTIDIADWRLHDLRRTVATNLQRLGVRFEVTEAVLNHVSLTQAGVASVYQRHDWANEKREALDRWGERLLEIIDEYHSNSQR